MGSCKWEGNSPLKYLNVYLNVLFLSPSLKQASWVVWLVLPRLQKYGQISRTVILVLRVPARWALREKLPSQPPVSAAKRTHRQLVPVRDWTFPIPAPLPSGIKVLSKRAKRNTGLSRPLLLLRGGSSTCPPSRSPMSPPLRLPSVPSGPAPANCRAAWRLLAWLTCPAW